MFRIGKTREREIRLVTSRGWGRGWKETASGHDVSFWSDKNVPELNRSAGCTTL